MKLFSKCLYSRLKRPSFDLSDKTLCISFGFILNYFNFCFVSQQQPTGELEFLLPGSVLFFHCRTGKNSEKTVRPGVEKELQRKILTHYVGESMILVNFTKQFGEKQHNQSKIKCLLI